MPTISDLIPVWRRSQDVVCGMRALFIVGCPKSGTTWIQNHLSGHPEVVVDGEGRFAWRMFPAIAKGVQAFNADQAKFVPNEVTHLRDVDLLMSMRQLIDMQLFRYLERAQRAGKDVSKVRVIGDKTPQHSVCLPLLNQLYPDALVIHIIRDPRDAATSGFFHFAQGDESKRVEHFRTFMLGSWAQAVTQARAAAKAFPERYLEVLYEDLIKDERVQLQRCARFLGVDASESAIDACVASGSFEQRSGGRARGQKDNKAFFRSGTVGDWRSHLDESTAAELCAPIADLMRSCGYDTARAATTLT
jgi:Sulfotransferase family